MAKKVGRKKSMKVGKDQLGAGLKVLLGSNAFEKKLAENQEEVVKELANTIAMLPIEQIEAYRDQPRSNFDEEALEELSESIKVHGIIQPLTVRRLSPHEYQLISGERRLRAAKMAGLEEIPAYIRIANDQEMLEMALVENIQREDLNAIEIAFTYKRLQEECKLTHENLAKRVGKDRTTVTSYLNILNLPNEMRTALKNKVISMGHARPLNGLKDAKLREQLFKEIINLSLSVRATEKRKKELLERQEQPKKSASSALPDDYANVQQKFRNFFGTRNGLKLKLKGEGKGQIVINFDTVDELNNLLDRIED